MKCSCGGYYNDWHSHASDCIILGVGDSIYHMKDYLLQNILKMFQGEIDDEICVLDHHGYCQMHGSVDAGILSDEYECVNVLRKKFIAEIKERQKKVQRKVNGGEL